MSLSRAAAALALLFALACGGGPTVPTEGVELIFGVNAYDPDLDAVAATLDRRLEALGVRARDVQPAPPDRVIVRLGPDFAGPDLVQTLQRPGRLEFRFAEAVPPDPLPPGALVFDDPYGDVPLVAVAPPVVTDVNVVAVEFGLAEYGAYVWLTFDEAGAAAFAEATGAHTGEKLLILVDGELMSAPIVRERIGGGKAQILMGYVGTPEEQEWEAARLAARLRSGALPAPVELLEQRAFGE